MSEIYSWAVVAWLGGILSGVAVADDITSLAWASTAMSVLAFWRIKRAEAAQ